MAADYLNRSGETRRPRSAPPRLERTERHGLAWHADPALVSAGVLVAFTERAGGVSRQPYAGLNLAGHVGDDPAAVDENRSRLLAALGLPGSRDRLTCAEQVHGSLVATVGEADAGAGAYAAGGRPPLSGADGLVTSVPGVPLMLCFADCVPVVLVAPPPSPAVAVVHAGWRGAAAGIAAAAAEHLARLASRSASSLLAYVGPSIGACHYAVGPETLSQFDTAFATMCGAETRLDLSAAVSAGLEEAGLYKENVETMRLCTAEQTDRFYSYRAEGVTGRHAALAVILV